MKNRTFISTQILGYVCEKEDEPNMMKVAALAEDLCRFCGDDPDAEMSINMVRVTRQRKETGNQVPAEGSILQFACKGGKVWGLTAERLEQLDALYGKHLDVMHECRRLADWCENNKPKRKMFNSMNDWVSFCLNRNFEKAKGSGESSEKATTDPRYND